MSSTRSGTRISEILDRQAERRGALLKGDVPGHEFHGNQYGASGGGSRSQNEGYGYHGEAWSARSATGTKEEYANEQAHKDFQARTQILVSEGHFKTTEQAREFLDSRAGRHYADQLAAHGDRSIHDKPTTPGARQVIRAYKTKGFGR